MSDGFEDGKDDGALRTIGEVSAALDIKTHVLRYWEQQFPMLDPLKRSGGRRYYRPDDVALVRRIDHLVNARGYTIKGAVAALEGGESGNGENRPMPHAANDQESREGSDNRSDIVARLKAIRSDLAAALVR